MRLTFLEHRNLLARHWGNDYSSLDTSDQTEIDNAINRCIEDICVQQKISMLKTSKIITLTAEYATGTVTIATSSGVSTVTGDGTAWTRDMIGRKLIISSDTIKYEIAGVASSTSLTLVETYINSADDTHTLSTASAYHIVKDTYLLPNNFAAMSGNQLRDLTHRRDLDLAEELSFEDDWAYNVNIGTVQAAALKGISETAYYSTGTVSVTKDSASITGTAEWTAEMSGLPFRRDSDSTEYVFTYVSATSGTLDRTYQGTTGTATYIIGFVGLFRLQFKQNPEKAAHIKIPYYKLLPKLLANNDVCPLPVHNAIISGSRWMYQRYREKGKIGVSNDYHGIYEKDLKGLRKISKIYPVNFGFRPRTG